MIFFKPCYNDENKNEIIFEAIENEIVSGKCRLIFDENKAVVDFLSYSEDKPYLVEGLLKSAFNYAALKNYYMGYCVCDNIIPFLEKMNFIKADGVYYNDIPSILQGNCCKK